MAEAEKTRIAVRYLYRIVQRSGPEPELLPGEIALGETLSVSRVTVRRAMAQLLERKVLLKLPGRKGTFTNPELARHIPNTIGIGYFSGYWNSMDEYTGQILGHFFRKLGSYTDFPYLYEYIHEGEKVDLEEKIRELNMRGLLWLSPTEVILPQLLSLAEKGYPVVITGAPHSPLLSGRIIYNGIRRDHQLFGRDLAALIAGKGWKKIIYLGEAGETLRCFTEELKKRNIEFPEENHLSSVDDMLKRLPKLLASGNVDAIYSDGNLGMYANLVKTVNKKKGKKPVIILEKLSSSLQHQRKNPLLQFCLFEEHNTLDYCRKAGTKAAEILIKMIRNPKGPFDSIKIS